MSHPLLGCFHGIQEGRIDDRGRVAVPAAMREVLLAKGEKELVVNWSLSDDSIWLLPPETFEVIRERLMSVDPTNPDFDSTDLKDYLNSGTTVQPLDVQGRIVLPPEARKWVGVESIVKVVGASDHIEVWDKDKHEARREALRGNTTLRRYIANRALITSSTVAPGERSR